MSTEDFVARGLRSLGLDVQPIPVGATKTPDFRVSDGTQTYLLEVKDKFPDSDSIRRREKALDSGGVWEEETELAYQNALSGVIREGADQLGSFNGESVDFRLLWLHARHRHEDTQLHQFQATLYGAVDLIDLDEGTDSATARRCFGLTSSEFFRLKDVLDGAFISTDQRGLLCLNHLSPRFAELRRSILCQAFPGICDPIEQEQAGTAYIADCGLSRRDREPVLDYVKQKYRRPRLIEFEPTHYSVETSVEPGRTRDEMAKRQMLSHENWYPIPLCGSTTGHVAERNDCATIWLRTRW